MALRDDLKKKLTDDTTLMAVLTGGVHTAVEISRSHTPAAFDANKELLPCCLLVLRGDTPEAPYLGEPDTASRTAAEFYFYQRHGYDKIDSALERVFALLHQSKVGAKTWQVIWNDHVRDQQDPALDAYMAMSRYSVYRML